jgi:hypothetical protein
MKLTTRAYRMANVVAAMRADNTPLTRTALARRVGLATSIAGDVIESLHVRRLVIADPHHIVHGALWSLAPIAWLHESTLAQLYDRCLYVLTKETPEQSLDGKR